MDERKRIEVTESPAYRRAFARWFRGIPLSKEEQAELDKGRDQHGTYAVPVAADPTVKPQ